MNRVSAEASVVGHARQKLLVMMLWSLLLFGLAAGLAHAQKEIIIGIGTQHTTTNTVTGGIVIKELGLLEKYLPKTGQYKDVKFKIDWQNFTSGPRSPTA